MGIFFYKTNITKLYNQVHKRYTIIVLYYTKILVRKGEMKKISCLLLIILLFTTVSLELDTNVNAKTTSTTNFFEKAINTARQSIRSIQHYSLLSVAKGTLTLITTGRITGSLRSIYLGNESIISRSKRIKVKGVNDGSHIELKGKGDTGAGYFFSIQTPARINKYSNSRRTFKTDPLQAKLSFSEDNNSTVEINLKANARGVRDKNKATLTGNFTKNINGQGIAKGRFILKLSAVSKNNPLPSIENNNTNGGPVHCPDPTSFHGGFFPAGCIPPPPYGPPPGSSSSGNFFTPSSGFPGGGFGQPPGSGSSGNFFTPTSGGFQGGFGPPPASSS